MPIDTRQIIDFASDGDATGLRDALYASIHDRVTSHIDAKKAEIAQGLLTSPDEQEVEVTGQEVVTTEE